MDRAIADPDIHVPIMKWWEGHYDRFFIVPHPFFRIRSVGSGGLPSGGYDEIIERGARPSDYGDLLKRRGEMVTWKSVHADVAPEVPRIPFYRAVWLLSCLGFAERADIDLQKRILAYCQDKFLNLPEDDAISPILHPAIGKFLAPFCGTDMVMYDEHRETSSVLVLSELDKDAPTIALKGRFGESLAWAIHVPDPGVLLTSRFDGAETLIAMTEKAHALSDPDDFFDTEPVDEDMYCDWLNPVEFFPHRKAPKGSS
ncbi:hypothetical protein [Phaeovulum sp. W22_SRMD_FR3]|uniref:hypothetical protein n=1 Tax=Phaeovulum sp. W22_SRMD_FR3 TaxID=3240274 RepID=UPI003F999219